MIRYIIALTFLLSCVSSCKKIKENIEQVQALSFITNGQWKVASITKDGTAYTADFSNYVFQFKDNGTVNAIKNGSVESTGSWSGNATTNTIQSLFPANAPNPLPLLNGSFQITKGGLNYVESTKTDNGQTTLLRLEKV